MRVAAFLLTLGCCLPGFTPLPLDPCLHHKTLHNATDRSSGRHTGAEHLCDRRIDEGWYRVYSPAGEDMPASCTPTMRCGTINTIWLNGTIPHITEGEVKRKACISTYENCCELALDIKIKNCGDYRVYYLVEAPGCSMAYCFGTKEPCPPDKVSNTGYPPCYDKTTLVSAVFSTKRTPVTTRSTSPALPTSTTSRPPFFQHHVWHPPGYLIAIIVVPCVVIFIAVIALFVYIVKFRPKNEVAVGGVVYDNNEHTLRPPPAAIQYMGTVGEAPPVYQIGNQYESINPYGQGNATYAQPTDENKQSL